MEVVDLPEVLADACFHWVRGLETVNFQVTDWTGAQFEPDSGRDWLINTAVALVRDRQIDPCFEGIFHAVNVVYNEYVNAGWTSWSVNATSLESFERSLGPNKMSELVSVDGKLEDNSSVHCKQPLARLEEDDYARRNAPAWHAAGAGGTHLRFEAS